MAPAKTPAAAPAAASITKSSPAVGGKAQQTPQTPTKGQNQQSPGTAGSPKVPTTTAESSPGRDHVEKLLTHLKKQSCLPSAGASVQARAGIAPFPSTWVGSDVDKPTNLIGTLGVDLSFVLKT